MKILSQGSWPPESKLSLGPLEHKIQMLTIPAMIYKHKPDATDLTHSRYTPMRQQTF
jgi:hypothetical protein